MSSLWKYACSLGKIYNDVVVLRKTVKHARQVFFSY